jgi:hypothetical protein
MVGVAESLFFALVLAQTAIKTVVWQLFGWPASLLVDPAAIGLVIVSPVLAGTGFAWLLSRQQSGPTARWRLGLVGPFLLISSTVGLVVASALEPVALSRDDSGRLLVFRIAFTTASGLAALLCTTSVAATLRLPSVWRRAGLTALVTAATYLVVLLLVDQLRGWHVGGGERAMVKVAMLGNLVAGTVGGVTAFRMLLR